MIIDFESLEFVAVDAGLRHAFSDDTALGRRVGIGKGVAPRGSERSLATRGPRRLDTACFGVGASYRGKILTRGAVLSNPFKKFFDNRFFKELEGTGFVKELYSQR